MTSTVSIELARALRDSALVWHPAVGDAFCIDRLEVDADVFILSDMTVEAHEFASGTVLGFNGTTEWALDSVSIDDTLWLPREDQLRTLLSRGFQSLEVLPDDRGYRVTVMFGDKTRQFEASTAVDAYARALLAYIDESLGDPLPDLERELPLL